MGEFILIIFNAVIIFFTLKFLIKITKEKIQSCGNINKIQKIESEIGGYMMTLCIINLWLATLGKLHVIFYIIFIITVGYIMFLGALTKG
ncbi:hypothetical protein [Clostridium magnum]|uniref:hypothetical protein n=1 Tax=Clostridium magnum TaxID=33954 RepID=UPI000921FBA0|nr:hypothetical protein [Clostridium magnum]SHI14940.1 hypothetical protein SAMN02745944_02770 [Clostridium magnum DSM 2767]